MSVRPRRHSVALACVVAVVVVGLVLIVPASPGGGSVRAPSFASAVRATNTSLTDTCPGSRLAQEYSGTVAIANSTIVPEVTLAFTYYSTIVGGPEAGLSNASACVLEHGAVRSGPNGTFDFDIDTNDTPVCAPWPGVGEYCNETTGPYESVAVTVDPPFPTGLVPAVYETGDQFVVRFYPALASLVLNSSGPSATYSTGATDHVEVEARSALGTPAPVAPAFNWTLAGAGWSFVGPTTGSSVNVTASPGAATANLSVVAALAAVTGELVTPPVGVALVAEPTTIDAADLNRTSVDSGEPLNLTVVGSGASGYAYVASVAPGLDLPSAAVPCAGTSAGPGTVVLACSTVLSYPSPGTARPVVSLSNGNSTGVWDLPAVEVAAPPAVALLPGAPAGYVGDPIPVTVRAENGSGTPPYFEACLATGIGAPTCSLSSGPAWTFDPTFPASGAYPVVAWTIDATGANRSVDATISVADPLALSASPAPENGSVGVPLVLDVGITGGVLPLHVWWNETELATPFASGTVPVDGTATAHFVPAAPGVVTASCTVVDALGAVIEATWTLSIGPGLANAVVPDSLASTATILAGEPFSVAWEAFDIAGAPVRTFASAAAVAIEPAAGGDAAPGWVNGSGVGALPTPVAGWFDVPASAWLDGTLNLSVTSARSGTFEVVLTVAASLASPPTPVPVVVRPDVDHLRLFDPVIATSGPRASSTLWQVTDAYGNPVPGAELFVTTTVPGALSLRAVPVLVEADGGTAAWVNYSAPGAGGGVVTVRDAAGDLVLPPIAIAAAPGILTVLAPLVAGLAAGATAVAVRTALRRRSRPRAAASVAPDPEDELRRLAEGRATVVEIVRRAGSADLATLAAEWRPLPAPLEIVDWVASLVTDGTLGATVGDDGIARFCLAPSREGRLHVFVDVDAFERGERRRSELGEVDDD